MGGKNSPEITVAPLILNKKGEILLIKSHKWSDKYVLPGGHVEYGEKIEDAVKREAKEETGLDIYGLELLLVGEVIESEEYFKKKHFICIAFECHADSEEVTLNDEATEYLWADPKSALKLDLANYTQDSIRKFLSKK